MCSSLGVCWHVDSRLDCVTPVRVPRFHKSRKSSSLFLFPCFQMVPIHKRLLLSLTRTAIHAIRPCERRDLPVPLVRLHFGGLPSTPINSHPRLNGVDRSSTRSTMFCHALVDGRLWKTMKNMEDLQTSMAFTCFRWNMEGTRSSALRASAPTLDLYWQKHIRHNLGQNGCKDKGKTSNYRISGSSTSTLLVDLPGM